MNTKAEIGKEVVTRKGAALVKDILRTDKGWRVILEFPDGSLVTAKGSSLQGKYLNFPKPKSKFYEGAVLETPKCGPVEILRMYPAPNRNMPKRADIRYIKTGTLQNVQVNNIANGKCWDCNQPSVYGVGYLGSYVKIPQRGENNLYRRAYDLWCNMLKRAYHKTQARFYSDVVVDVRWHSFKNFWNSLEDLPGYEEWVVSPGCMELDKDKLSQGSRVYSKDTCCFLPHSENMKYTKRANRAPTNAGC